VSEAFVIPEVDWIVQFLAVSEKPEFSDTPAADSRHVPMLRFVSIEDAAIGIDGTA